MKIMLPYVLACGVALALLIHGAAATVELAAPGGTVSGAGNRFGNQVQWDSPESADADIRAILHRHEQDIDSLVKMLGDRDAEGNCSWRAIKAAEALGAMHSSKALKFLAIHFAYYEPLIINFGSRGGLSEHPCLRALVRYKLEGAAELISLFATSRARIADKDVIIAAYGIACIYGFEKDGKAEAMAAIQKARSKASDPTKLDRLAAELTAISPYYGAGR